MSAMLLIIKVYRIATVKPLNANQIIIYDVWFEFVLESFLKNHKKIDQEDSWTIIEQNW